MISLTASGSVLVRCRPSRWTSSSRASTVDSRSSISRWAPSIATSGVSWWRLVTMARQPADPGGTGDVGDDHRDGLGGGEERVGLDQLRVASGEGTYRRGQVSGYRLRGGHHRDRNRVRGYGGVERRILPQHGDVLVAERRT